MSIISKYAVINHVRIIYQVQNLFTSSNYVAKNIENKIKLIQHTGCIKQENKNNKSTTYQLY
jgi:hypothetical protein